MNNRLFFILLLLFLVSISLFAVADSCEYRWGSCNFDEVGVISLYKESNSHISAFGAGENANLHLCCDTPDLSVSIEDGCSIGSYMISMSGYYSDEPFDRHAGDTMYYDVDVCLDSTTIQSCYFGDDCGDDLCMLSLRNPTLRNSHVGVCDAYDTKVCCGISDCGNGFVEYGEQCDDGNTISGDGCSQFCTLEVNCSIMTGCGDGSLDEDGEDDILGNFDDEECDDNNRRTGDGCNALCKRERCGDGLVDADGRDNIAGNLDDEECEPSLYAQCNAQCKIRT